MCLYKKARDSLLSLQNLVGQAKGCIFSINLIILIMFAFDIRKELALIFFEKRLLYLYKSLAPSHANFLLKLEIFLASTQHKFLGVFQQLIHI